MKSKHVLAAAVVTLIGATAIASTTAFAQNSTDSHHPMTDIVQRIAEKFGLNQDDVQSVFNQLHDEHVAQRVDDYQNRLNQLVSDGKITQSQKQLILNKHEELQTQRQQDFDNFKNLTPEEHRQQREQQRTELETWAQQNDIDPQYLMFGPDMGRARFPGMGRGHHLMDFDNDSNQ